MRRLSACGAALAARPERTDSALALLGLVRLFAPAIVAFRLRVLAALALVPVTRSHEITAAGGGNGPASGTLPAAHHCYRVHEHACQPQPWSALVGPWQHWLGLCLP